MAPHSNYFHDVNLDFSDTQFDLLMQKRIHKVLLICSSYDAFMLEEDGRIEELIFNEYVLHNLRYPPSFVRASSATEAIDVLQSEPIDLVISMLNIGEIDTFEMAKMMKSICPQVPIAVLTHFSREVSLKLEKEDLSAVDFVFSWLGNSELLLSIIKLIEDRMNAEHDILEVGVQTIILVEDSIRYYSSYLPHIYKVVLQQSKMSMREALNEQQQMLRMRGRPKILLATNFEEAKELYDKYKDHLLGVISDITYKMAREDTFKVKAGFELCRMVRSDDPHMPFILQSSDKSNSENARELGVGFIYKYSRTLYSELRHFIVSQFAFGDFIFIDPETGQTVGRANNLEAMQAIILTIPDSSLQYHASRNHISKWLFARALFPVAEIFKRITPEDFQDLVQVRQYIHQSISNFRFKAGRGVISKFDRTTYNKYLTFARIGDGSLGGKARGLAFINNILNKHKLFDKYPGILITIPRTVVLSTDIFDEFMESNGLSQLVLDDLSDEEILRRFLDCPLPEKVIPDLQTFIGVVSNPIAVRSSSKLEDSYYQPFAGIYSTYMIPRSCDDKRVFLLLCQAIKSVYASVFYRSSKAYIAATSNVIDEEKMGIVLQEVTGSQHENLFYPTVSGVARSINFYPIGSEKAEHGIASIAYGLGKYIVDGGISLRFSPRFPKKVLQLSTPEMALRDTQKIFFGLDLSPETFVPSTDDGVNLRKMEIADAPEDSVRHVASSYDHQSGVIMDTLSGLGPRVVTFSNILKHKTFPLAEILAELLEIGQREMNNSIEIEFAINLETPKGQPKVFSFLQIRPIVEADQLEEFSWDGVDLSKALVYSESALGNGRIHNIVDFIYVKPESFDAAKSMEIAAEMEELNARFIQLKRNYVLVGPGRWGSSDSWLGIPVKWSQISEARVIVEAGQKNFRVDPSQGTHFFQNLTAFGIGYLTINPFLGDGVFNQDLLDSMPTEYESDQIRWVRFDNPLDIIIDGKKSRGLLLQNTEMEKPSE
ncbi:PEP/pyruvate-binding domain-containing protein [Williamwhitmania taraxaci]|uniref:Response regulator receiver domain-containing protein n=1 Tax=Williamwhitmania taraxaci TaxID=1640674 RepID=A0A1G6HP28_9BACT|nr:PEP/pyruvate-binding domain-containing protein [Williamwhitmania taraxaci]SDB96029.1 Response regulator receiver domain-containing protein [Williamwhitmania taraxaci]